MASDRFMSLKELTANSKEGTFGGYTTNAKMLYGGVFGESLYFPSELGTRTANHYMVFFINELMGGKYKDRVASRLSSDSPVFYQKNSTSNAKLINDISKASGKVLGVEAPTYKRTAVCIALPVPDVLNTAIDAQWCAVDASLMNIAAFGNDMASVYDKDGAWAAIKQAVSRGVQKGATKFAANLLGDSGNQVTKSSNNTRKEVMFDSMMPRRFSFQWTFYPKSAEESKSVWDIIQMFKYHMTAEYDESTSGLFIDFPNTFDIEIHSNGKRNNWLPKTSTCALTRLDINYTPGGSFAFFEEIANGKNYPDGAAPVGITIAAEFAEIEVLYRNRLDPEGDYSFGNGAAYKQRPDGGTF